MTEQEIAAALEGKFFRGPTTFHQCKQTDPVDVEDLDPAPVPVHKRPEREMIEVAPTKWKVPVNLCIDAACAAHKISRQVLLDMTLPGRKKKEMVLARQHAVWLVHNLRPDFTVTQIADRMNYKDHTTVLHGIKRFESIKTRMVPEIEESIEYLREMTGDQTICTP